MATDSRKARRKKRKKQKNIAKSIAKFLFVAVIAASLFIYLNDSYFHIEGVPTFSQIMQYTGLRKRPKIKVNQDEIAVHFLDVRQGDCALITTPDKNVLIDCGEANQAGYVIQYLKDFGVSRLDYVIGTHPHSDHIGGMHKILSAFEVGEVIMPEIPDELIPTTDYYDKMLDVIKDKKISAYYSEVGYRINLSKGTYLELLSPQSMDYDDLNDYSIISKLTSGNISFLFTGDAERKPEQQLIDRWVDISADVLKVGHHGSSSSSSYAFLKRVNPEYAVISVAADNSYGHPTDEALERLKSVGAEIITTMEEGDIVFVTDGNTLTYTTTNTISEAA